MVVTDPRVFEAVRTGLEVIAAIRSLHPDRFDWVRTDDGYWLDRLVGTDRLRRAIEDGVPVEQMLEQEHEAVERFRDAREKHLLY